VLTVALVTCAQFTSPLVLGPWAGVMADRFGGRRTLLWTELVSAATAAIMAVLVFAGRLNEAGLIVGAIVVGLTFTFALPARNVTVRRLVPEKTRAGYAMDSVSYNLGRAVGPPLGVGIIATIGFGYVFAINAASFLIFTVVLWLTVRGTTEPERRSRVRDGFLVAFRDHRIRMPATWSGAFIAALGAGSVIGSLLPTRREPSIRLAATALASLAVCMMFFALAPWMWLSVAAAFAAGVACLVANSATRTLLAKEAGLAREASVMAVWAIAWAGSKPIASLADGLSATHLGIRPTGVLLALPALIPLLVIIAATAAADFRKHRTRKTGMADNALVTHNR
jgi:predicted MFS family arabinose efflux permease